MTAGALAFVKESARSGLYSPGPGILLGGGSLHGPSIFTAFALKPKGRSGE